MSRVRRFVESDIQTLDLWLKGHGLQIDFNALPPVGFIAPNAIGFVVTTDSHFCLLEALLSNPKALKASQIDLDLVVEACLDYAKQKGYSEMVALTANRAVVQRAKNHGFKIEPKTLLERML